MSEVRKRRGHVLFRAASSDQAKSLALKLRVPRAFVIAKRPRDPRLSQKTHGSFVVLALIGGQDVQRPCDRITAATLASESDECWRQSADPLRVRRFLVGAEAAS